MKSKALKFMELQPKSEWIYFNDIPEDYRFALIDLFDTIDYWGKIELNDDDTAFRIKPV